MSDSTCIHLISGEVFDFLDPMSATITPHDVAHALARVGRYGGHHAAETYSVAQHTLLCFQLVIGWYHDRQHAFGALNHDNAEIITGDWTTPMKNWIRELGVDYSRKIEAPVELAICSQLGLVLDDLHAGVVKTADAAAYEIEVRRLKPYGYATYQDLDEDLMTYGSAWLEKLLALPVQTIEAVWLTVFHALGQEDS